MLASLCRPASVRRCIEELGVRRIQHGVRCIEDPAVVDLILEKGRYARRLPDRQLEAQVEGIRTMKDHPIRQLFDAGVHCAISSDDPLMFGNTLGEEYYALSTDLNFTESELQQIAKNGFDVRDRYK